MGEFFCYIICMLLKRIDNINAPELDPFARLTERELYHPQKGEGLFIAESPVVIERALDAHYEPVSLLMEEKHIEGSAKTVIERCGDIPVYTAELETLEQITGYALTRGVLCAMKRKPLPAAEEICRDARRIAVLEEVMNPTNVGAIFRSAAALNMDAVLLTKGSCDVLYRRAVRVSMGTVFQIPWSFVESVESVKELGFATAALALSDDSISIDDPVLEKEEKLALVLGTEGDGLKKNTISACDYTVKIPMAHGVDSLNVAAASAVAFWQINRF